MKKHLPNILLLTVILTNIFFMGSYIKNNGIGLFLSTTGIVFLILGVIIFIYFLSIDPGYGWSKSIDLTKNYIMIFTSMAVGMTGIVFIVSGQHMNDLHIQKTNSQIRCKELLAGNVEEILKKDWFSLRDQKKAKPLSVYLFQKKSDRNNYKIIATKSDQSTIRFKTNLVISSNLISNPIVVEENNSVCQGVLEKDISIDFEKHQKLNEFVQFNITVTIPEDTIVDSVSAGKVETLQFTLQNKASESKLQAEPETQVSTQATENYIDKITLNSILTGV